MKKKLARHELVSVGPVKTLREKIVILVGSTGIR
jgi:hypothetical protein